MKILQLVFIFRSKLEHIKDLEQTKIEENKENIADGEETSEEEMDCENNFINIDEDMEATDQPDKESEESKESKESEELEKAIDQDDQEIKARDEKIHTMEESLADLADEITIKQRLVEELEKSQKKIFAMKLQYEEKLNLLNNQIRSGLGNTRILHAYFARVF